ncbi:hypothetical protein V8C86DRAFT_1285568 [Haematococcus lacustris]
MSYVRTLCTLHAPILNCRGITADCDGYEVVCCVEEEGVGWVVKRSRAGAGFAMLFSVDFEPSGFVANGTSFWLSNVTSIMEYNAAGECLQSIPGPSKASYMEFFGDTLYFLAYDDKGRSALYALDEDSKAIMLMAHHVEPSGGFAIFPADQKLLFTNTSNNLCELDLQSGECQGLRVSLGSEGGRLLTGNNELALLIVCNEGGSSCCSCSVQGGLCYLESMSHSAVNGEYCINSQGDLLFFSRPEEGLPRLKCMHGLLH